MRDLTLQCRQSLNPQSNGPLFFGNHKSSSSSLKCYYRCQHPKSQAIMDHIERLEESQEKTCKYKSTIGYTQTTSMMAELVAPRTTKVILNPSKKCIAIAKHVYLQKTSPHLKDTISLCMLHLKQIINWSQETSP